jgi:VWFA-related protein
MREHYATSGNRVSRTSIAASLVFLLMLATSAGSRPVSSSQPSGADEYKISVSVGLVLLPVTVTDRTGAFVPGLRRQDFRIYEAGRLQQITFFEPEDVPVTVGLVVDNSGSMAAKRAAVMTASLAFVGSSNPQDQMFVVNFNQKVSLGLPKSVPFTNDLQQLRGALSKNPAAGNTALYDAIAAGLQHLTIGTGVKKALIVVTDGGDNASRVRFQHLLKTAESSNAIIYTIGILDPRYSDVNPGVLRQLSKVTGGRAYFPGSATEVLTVCEQISHDLRQQYTMGYIPTDRTPGMFRTLHVTAQAAGKGKLHVRTRAGYLIPPEMQDNLSMAQKGAL